MSQSLWEELGSFWVTGLFHGYGACGLHNVVSPRLREAVGGLGTNLWLACNKSTEFWGPGLKLSSVFIFLLWSFFPTYQSPAPN